jgi:hypothetical protein
MSGLLTTTIPKMADTIKLLAGEGLRGSVKVMVGGARVTQASPTRSAPTPTAPTPPPPWRRPRSWCP